MRTRIGLKQDIRARATKFLVSFDSSLKSFLLDLHSYQNQGTYGRMVRHECDNDHDVIARFSEHLRIVADNQPMQIVSNCCDTLLLAKL